MQHAPTVAADREQPAPFDPVVGVEHEALRLLRNAAAVAHRLAVVLAGGLQAVDAEQPPGGGPEAQVAQARRQLRLGDRQRAILHQARIGESRIARQAQKVVPVEGAAQAFAAQHRVLRQRLRHPPVGIDVGEIELAAGAQQPPGLAQYRALVLHQVDDAVGDDEIEAARLQRQRLQVLDVPFQEGDVGAGMTEAFAVPFLVGARDRELFRSHVHPHHLALLAHQLREHITVLTRAAAQIQHPQPLQQRRDHQAAAVEAATHLRMHPGQRGAHMRRHLAGGAAGAGLEIVGAVEHLAVVVPHLFADHLAPVPV